MSTATTTEKILTDEMIAEIKEFISHYPSKQAVTLPALHVVNEKLRHVPLQAVVEIAELLGLAPADVQDTLTFYGFFKQDKPHGETRHLLGADQLIDHACHKLHLQPGETTADGKLTIEYAECLGACEYAPCMLAGKELHKCLNPAALDKFLDDARK